MYLYFYAGEYSNSVNIQTSEVSSELLNLKADIDLNNVPNSKGILKESYVNGSSWYRVYADGWCLQGGITPEYTGEQTITLLKTMQNTNYTIQLTAATGAKYYSINKESSKTETSFGITYTATAGTGSAECHWVVYGYTVQ